MLVVVVALLAVVGAVLGLRMVQGQPPAASFEASAAAATSSPAGAAEAVHVVAEGDTLWAIAQDLAPGRDPRPVVDALAARNGGTALRAGDLLVIPSELLPGPAVDGLASGVADAG
jgi:Tfp pilus assembly protein FimV